MITSVRAFEVAHQAIEGKRYHDTPCDISIERVGPHYAVVFSNPKIFAAGAPALEAQATRVVVDADSGTVREVLHAMAPERDPRLKGFISGKRAFDVGLASIRTVAATYDERWTITVVLHGDKYYVTFPVPEAARAAQTEGADYALQVRVDARTAAVVEIKHAS